MLKLFFRLLLLGWLGFIFVIFLSGFIGDAAKSPYIAWLSERNRSKDIVVADSASGLNIALTNNSNREADLSWSLDGRYLTYRIADVPDTIIWLFDTADGSLESLDIGEYSYYYWYAPEQLMIITNRTGEIRLLNVETGEASLYSEPCTEWDCVPPQGIGSISSAYDLILSMVDGQMQVEIDYTPYSGLVSEPNMELQPWSPDRQSFLFITALQGQPDIYLSPVEGGIARRLTNTESPEQDPRWSPDGEKISYVSYETGNPEIVILELATGNRYNISRHPNRDDSPVWQPLR